MVQAAFRTLIKQERDRRKQQSNYSHCSDGDTRAIQDLQLLRQGADNQQPLELKRFAVSSSAVQGLHYVPEFLTPDEAAAAVRSIEAAPSSRWVSAGERRMQNWGGKPGTARIVEALPPFLSALVDRLVAASLYDVSEAPNHCLINAYSAGAGIPPHQDGPLYLERVATVTLAGPALISLHRAEADGSPGRLVTTASLLPPVSSHLDCSWNCSLLTLPTVVQCRLQVLLREGCLFVVAGQAYTSCLHSIASQTEDLITESCCNAEVAGVAVGDIVPRAQRRFSLVFVHKKQSC